MPDCHADAVTKAGTVQVLGEGTLNPCRKTGTAEQCFGGIASPLVLLPRAG
jgi:hypothetical protein